MTNATRAVYTALIGDYETLSELKVAKEPGIDYLLFTDDPKLKSKTWKVIHVQRTWPADPIRSQREIKIIGHPLLEKYQTTLYIDNNVVLKKLASELFELLPKNSEIALAQHALRETLQAEFDAVKRQSLDAAARLNEQNQHYKNFWPELLNQQPLWGGLILRRNTQAVKTFNRTWYEHILRYSRRDQLSLQVALTLAKPKIKYLDIMNEESDFHYRDHAVRKVTRDQARASEPDYEHEIEALTKRINQLENSFSWRITKPLRALKQKR
jgi:hypothetical protein